MDFGSIVMIVGFLLAAYSVVGNDVIQTLGTFLSSNEKRPWYVLWAFAASIMVVMLVGGYIGHPWFVGADTIYPIAYGRLDKFFPLPETLAWYYLLPPITLVILTRMGIPISTTFMILTLFSLSSIEGDSVWEILGTFSDPSSKLFKMTKKSLMGYGVSFGSAMIIYLLISGFTEKYFIKHPLKPNHRPYWVAAQWFSTGFLWSQWLSQDLANIYVYLLGRGNLAPGHFALTVVALVGLLAYIFYSKGGAVQGIVKSKTNTIDIRSATFIDLIYGLVMYTFKYDYFGIWGAKVPMSTTWIFIGLLAGREIGLRLRLENRLSPAIIKMIGKDLAKVLSGLVISVVLVIVIKLLGA